MSEIVKTPIFHLHTEAEYQLSVPVPLNIFKLRGLLGVKPLVLCAIGFYLFQYPGAPLFCPLASLAGKFENFGFRV